MSEKVNVTIPTIGESISEGTIGKWFFKEGDLVKKDQPLFEVDSDKATLEVPAAATGKLSILLPEGKAAAIGALVGLIETINLDSAASKSEMEASIPKATPPVVEAPKAPSLPTSAVNATTTSSVNSPSRSVSTSTESLKSFSPSKRRAIRNGSFKVSANTAENFFGDASLNEVRKPMSVLRRRIAERLLESQQTTATLTTFNEIDMSAAMNLRSKLKDDFAKKYGVKLGFMSFFSRAVIEALKHYPDVNAHIDGTDLVYPLGIHLGMAVSTERGLVVPVVKDAQELSYSELEKRIADLADRARLGKLQIPEMSGGTFTITNGGVFGSLLSTPIINPPQSGILGMHKIENRPIAVAKADGGFDIQVRPMMYVALSYDHRIIDGATSVGFLVKVKEYLETVTESLIN